MKFPVISMYFVLALAFSIPTSVYGASASVAIKLSPAGGFTGKTAEVKGTIKKVGDKYVGENIIVNLKSLKTGMGLRDKHTQEHLGTDKFPEAILVKAVGEKGIGKGILKIRGIDQPVEGTYTVKGNDLTATFKVTLSKYGIEKVRYMSIGVKDEAVVTVTVPIK
jgi:polyisoprenoid-binding protein YceI